MTLKTMATVERDQQGKAWLRLDEADRAVSDRIVEQAIAKGRRVRVEIALEVRRRTDAQNALYWTTLPTLFAMVNGYRPTREELEAFHEEFKAIHGPFVASKLRPGLMVPVRMRDSDVLDAKVRLDALFAEMAEHGGSSPADEQARAREAWQDYWIAGGPVYADHEDFRTKARLCAACGRGGPIQQAHIVSRGADPARVDDPTNWLPLCHEHHREQHQHGWGPFLGRFPHLTSRWEAAQTCA